MSGLALVRGGLIPGPDPDVTRASGHELAGWLLEAYACGYTRIMDLVVCELLTRIDLCHLVELDEWARARRRHTEACDVWERGDRRILNAWDGLQVPTWRLSLAVAAAAGLP